MGCLRHILLLGLFASRLSAQPLSPVTIDYPLPDSVFPPEITAPTFIWRGAGVSWQLEVTFPDGGSALRLTGSPDRAAWSAIVRHRSATVTITGFDAAHQAVSRGSVSFSISRDPVGAPIFYRDVPLMPSQSEKGVIKPLAQSNVPLIAWRLRDIAQPESRLVMTGLHTCANCHSFSADGKTLGMDVDGPENDKGTYAIAPVQPHMSIRTQDVMTWNSFAAKPPGHHTIGFLSQISPDGQYVVSTVNEEVYVANFMDYRFLQVFYPTRGILAWYSRATGRIQALPGADNPQYVHTDAVWSPDGKYLVFARAEAKDPYPPGRPAATYANDPNEIPIQYDLYRMPFNGGKGGTPEPIAGASRNGMSNTFPKISPDGRWIVFVKCRNGQLMRPDSELWIVPAGGGTARRMRANTSLMNSWHSFSPNGRWLVFSSKSRSPYTQMFLTHIDENGEDSPAIWIENTTAGDRAVNLPEFVNIAAGGLETMEVPAAQFYETFDHALELMTAGSYDAAIGEWTRALQTNPGDPKVHNNLGVALVRKGRLDDGIVHFRKAIKLRPEYADAYLNLGGALEQKGDPDGAIAQYRKTIEYTPTHAEARDRLGTALVHKGKLEEGIAQFRRAVEIDPRYAEALNDLGIALLEKGDRDQAIATLRRAVAVDPRYAGAYNNLGVALVRQGRLEEAAAQFQEAVDCDPRYVEAWYSLGKVSYARGKVADAIAQWRRGLAVDPGYQPILRQLEKLPK